MALYLTTDYEYSLNNGTTWNSVTSDMDNGNGTVTIPVGNVDIPAGSLHVRVKASGTRPSGAILANPVAFTAATPQTFDLFISSTGNNSNDGSSEASAVSDIATLKARAIAHGDGVKIKFLEEIKYREELQLGAINEGLNNVEVDGNFSTLDASDIVPKNEGLWTQPDPTNYPRVWKISWSLNQNIREGYTLTIDNLMPILKDSVAQVNSTVGSAHMPSSFYSSNPIDIYIHVVAGENPNTNARVYEIMKRYRGFFAGNNAKVSKLITKTQIDNDGSFVVGSNALVKQSLFVNGHKHNVFIGSGTMEDCISFNADFNPAAAPFIGYMNDPTGHNLVWRRCFLITDGKRGHNVSGFFAHGDSQHADKFNDYTIEECIAVNSVTIGKMTVQGTPTFRNNYSNAFGLDGGEKTMTVERCLFNAKGDGAASFGGGVLTLKNSAYYLPFGNFKAILQPGSTATGLTIDHCVFTGPAPYRSIYDTSGNNHLNMNFHHSIFLVFGEKGNCPANATYVGDYNIFWQFDGSNPFLNIKSRWHGQELSTLAQWQQNSGQDANSVWLTTAQKNNFFLGDPATGDFRINPNAQVTAANGTVYTGTFPDGTPITNAGPQEHWNYNTRSIVGGPTSKWPTPPIDEAQSVSYIKNPAAWNFYP